MNDKVTEFLKSNLFKTKRNLAHDEEANLFIAHFVLDRAELEDFLGASIDDATCEIVLDKYKEGDHDYLLDVLNCVNVFESNFKYGDGVFHSIIIFN